MITLDQISTDHRNPTYAIDTQHGYKLKLFMYNGSLCRQTMRMKRQFWHTSVGYLDQLELAGAPTKRTMTPQQAAAKALRMMHPNYGNPKLRTELAAIVAGTRDIEGYRDMLVRPKFRNITRDFDSWQLERIRRAFEGDDSVMHEGAYSTPDKPYTSCDISRTARSNSGRDLSATVQKYSDGKVLAWFSSEYAGCGNGDYYILINPTTALFVEKD